MKLYYIPVLNMRLIKDNLGSHNICILKENQFEGSIVCFLG